MLQPHGVWAQMERCPASATLIEIIYMKDIECAEANHAAACADKKGSFSDVHHIGPASSGPLRMIKVPYTLLHILLV